MDSKCFDSLIFDMDGTLWDAVDSYCEIWNVSLRECGYKRPDIVRDQLTDQMGTTLDHIIEDIAPKAAGDIKFLETLYRNEQKMMPELGGRLYPGVKDIIPELARDFRLFMVSNCSADGLPTFLKYTGLEPYFTDSLSYGQTNQGKDTNIRELIDRYQLDVPLYIGDTQGDANACAKAGIPIAWASYGFGTIVNPDYTLKSFNDLKQIVLQCNKI